MAIAPGSKDVGGVMVARWRVPPLEEPAPPPDEPPPQAARLSIRVATVVATRDLRMGSPGVSGPARSWAAARPRERKGNERGDLGCESPTSACGACHALSMTLVPAEHMSTLTRQRIGAAAP